MQNVGSIVKELFESFFPWSTLRIVLKVLEGLCIWVLQIQYYLSSSEVTLKITMKDVLVPPLAKPTCSACQPVSSRGSGEKASLLEVN